MMKYLLPIMIVIACLLLVLWAAQMNQKLVAEQAAFQERIDLLEGRMAELEKQYAVTKTSLQKKLEESGILSINGLSGKFVNNNHAGQLYVIYGMVKNLYIVPKTGVKVLGTLYNREGEALQEQEAFCGHFISVEDLQDMPVSEIHRLMGQAGHADLKPGGEAPFTIVFTSLDRAMHEYSVDVVQGQ